MGYVKQLTEKLNDLLKSQGKPLIKQWKQSTLKLEQRIKKEIGIIESTTNGDAKPADPVEKSEPKKKPKKAYRKKNKITIASVCREGFDSDQSKDEIHTKLMELAGEDKLDYTIEKKWYITWYSSAFKRKAASLEVGNA